MVVVALAAKLDREMDAAAPDLAMNGRADAGPARA
jgi:hypothetical protein